MDAGSVPRRGAAAALVFAATLLAAGCGAARTTQGPAAVSSFRNNFMAFRHPTAWRPVVYKTAGTLHFHPIVYLSTQPTHAPCRQQASATVCDWPVNWLRPGGVLIVWENRGFPGWSLDPAPGLSLRVGGRQAKRTVTHPGECTAIGADETIEVAIARPLPENWTAFTACLRAPELITERQVDALLASTRFIAP